MPRAGQQGDEPVVDVAALIVAKQQRVWDAIVRAQLRSQWWSHLALDARAGGRFEERWTGESGESKLTTGRVLELAKPSRIRLSWSDEDWPAATEVTIKLDADANELTTVRVRHTGWNRIPGGPHLAVLHRDGWLAHLRNLNAFLGRES